MTRTIAIVGGGFSGAMLAARLAEAGATVSLIERRPEVGLGVAYSTICDAHLLNVRSGRMSARADRPRDFVDWLEANRPELADPEGFAPRRVYGDYVRTRFAEARAAWPHAISVIESEAVAVDDHGVTLADGRHVAGDAVVLATGNPPPRMAGSAGPDVIADPWAPGALAVIRPSDAVVVIGTGLTMIDVMLSLSEAGWLGRATAISRRGLTPRPHDAVQPPVSSERPVDGALSARLGAARRRAEDGGWAAMMDRLRSLNADLWRGLSTADRARFLRHLRPWWDVHRHRVAPGPWATVSGLIADGRLTIRAGRVRAIDSDEGRVTVVWTPRGQTAPQSLRADRVIDCTGPGHAPERSPDPLIRGLISSGRGRSDALGLGLDVDAEGRLIDRDGLPSARLSVLGPPALAAFWETVAVPDIRERVDQLTRRLTA